jgi:hypothetical protein
MYHADSLIGFGVGGGKGATVQIRPVGGLSLAYQSPRRVWPVTATTGRHRQVMLSGAMPRTQMTLCSMPKLEASCGVDRLSGSGQ